VVQRPVMGLFADYLQTQQKAPVDFSNVSASDLASLDLSGLNLGNINIPSYNQLNAALTGTSTAPSTLDELIALYNQQSSLLSSVGTLENVDINDRPYWYNSGVAGALANPLGVSGEDFRVAAGLPDSFSIYDSGQGITQENAEAALSLLNSSEDTMQALSQYYGIDFQRAENPEANYTNASKYGSDEARLAEFQATIEPVLQKVIPYLQLTQGLRYDEALEYAYKNDPMISALYNQYGVDLFRQTDDGSTYFFDPISGTESRTIEVKDSSFRDVGLALTIAAASAILGPAIGEALGGTPLANATGKALASGFKTVASGGDFNDVLKSMITAGVVDYGLSQLAENIDLQETLNEFGENFGIGSEISLSGEYTTLADGTIVLTETMGTQGNLGDLLAGVADAIQNPSSWTPSSIEEANIIWNLAGEAVTTGGSLVGEGGLTVGTFYDLLKTAYGVYRDSNQPPPKLPNDFTITFDPNTNDPIIIDKDGNAVVGIPSAEDERKDKDDGGDGGQSEAAKDAAATEAAKDAAAAEAKKDAEAAEAKKDAEAAEAKKDAEAAEAKKDAEAEAEKDKDNAEAEKDKDNAERLEKEATETEKDKDNAEAEKDKDNYDPENPWIYRGNGVFEHVKTGETRTEDVSEYDPYVIGEYYGGGQVPEDFQDSDGDGIPDNEDDDIDGDGYVNILDFDPFDPNVWEDPDVVAERLNKEATETEKDKDNAEAEKDKDAETEKDKDAETEKEKMLRLKKTKTMLKQRKIKTLRLKKTKMLRLKKTKMLRLKKIKIMLKQRKIKTLKLKKTKMLKLKKIKIMLRLRKTKILRMV
jgi:hypothetical protein